MWQIRTPITTRWDDTITLLGTYDRVLYWVWKLVACQVVLKSTNLYYTYFKGIIHFVKLLISKICTALNLGILCTVLKNHLGWSLNKIYPIKTMNFYKTMSSRLYIQLLGHTDFTFAISLLSILFNPLITVFSLIYKLAVFIFIFLTRLQ